MDLMMPRMDGWEATRCLKADERTKDSAIIAVCAHTLGKRLAGLVRLFFNGGSVSDAPV
jgi:CheY-like chemotaxis protein